MSSLAPIDWLFVTNRLSQASTCEIGRTILLNTSPLSSPQLALEEMQNIIEAQAILKSGQRPQTTSLDLFESWYQRLAKGAVLKTLELRDIRTFCNEVLSLQDVIKSSPLNWCKKLRDQLMDVNPPLSAVDHMISADGEIRTDASETLFLLYQEKKQKALQIQHTLDSLVHQHQMEPILQDKYVTNREGRWVLPIKSGMQHSFSGIIHATSQTKQTVFMEPNEIVPLNNRLREVEDLIEQEIEKLLRQLSTYLASFKSEWVSTKSALVSADVCLAKAQISLELDSTPCKFSEVEINLVNLRHPVLVLKKEKVISNNIDLNKKNRILLLSGPNAGGKTVLLKSIGLAAQMARCGLPICADKNSTVPFFKNIFVIVGDAQNVDLHLSTFAAHLNSLKQACDLSSSNNLLLVDEICGSTDPEEGSALARSFIEKFSSNTVFAIITSHLGPLKLGWDENSGVLNGSLESDVVSGVPTYKFISGVPGQSLAIQTAKRVGVNLQLIDRAISLLSPQSQLHKRTMDEAQTIKERLAEKQKELDRELANALNLKAQYTELVDKFKSERAKWMEKSIQKAERKIEDLIAQAKVAQTFERHEKLNQAKKDLVEVVSFSDAKSKGQPTSAEEFIEKFPPGTQVMIQTLGRQGIIQSNPNSSGEVFVLSESMRISVHWKNLSPTSVAERPNSSRSISLPSYLVDTDPTLDLRGKRVDEAIQDLEIALDQAITKQNSRIKVIHGHGTEALKRAIRMHLSRSPHVKGWKAASSESGGDGVTWVEFL